VLSNTGNATLNISGITITGTNPTDFAVATTGTTCGTTLAQSATCNIAVTFTPLSAVAFTATLSVADNATGTPQTATLTGTGTAPQALLAPTPVPFNTQTVNTTSTAQIVMLSNPGNATLNISGITITGTNAADFAVATTGTTCGTTLAQSTTCNIAVTFTPLSAVAFTATLSVADNVTGSPQTATLTGTGVALPAPQALLTPTAVPFNNQIVNTTAAAQVVVLSNPGNATLNISGITITGTNVADFAINTASTTCGSTLAQSGTCNIAVTFTPLSIAAFTATLSVADNATGTPQTATLTGSGISASTADFAVAATTTTQTVAPGAAAQFSLNVSALNGTFGSAVTLTASGLPSGATASFSPASVTPGSASAPSVLSIQTPIFQAALTPLQRSHDASRIAWFALLAVPLFLLRRKNRSLRQLPKLVLILLISVMSLSSMIALSGCSGGYYGPPPQSYQVTITGTSGSTQHSTTVTLTVQ
jgi:phosphopantothenate synthetase